MAVKGERSHINGNHKSYYYKSWSSQQSNKICEKYQTVIWNGNDEEKALHIWRRRECVSFYNASTSQIHFTVPTTLLNHKPESLILSVIKIFLRQKAIDSSYHHFSYLYTLETLSSVPQLFRTYFVWATFLILTHYRAGRIPSSYNTCEPPAEMGLTALQQLLCNRLSCSKIYPGSLVIYYIKGAAIQFTIARRQSSLKI